MFVFEYISRQLPKRQGLWRDSSRLPDGSWSTSSNDRVVGQIFPSASVPKGGMVTPPALIAAVTV